MHGAPSVSYPVGRSRWAAALLAAAWLGGAAAALLWGAEPQVAAWRLGAVWLALLATGALSLWHWWHGPRGALAWDGAGWTWNGSRGDSQAGSPQLSLDLQRLLLVRWQGAGGGSQWLWLERASCADRWDDLRRAVYSRARPEARPAAEPPAAKP